MGAMEKMDCDYEKLKSELLKRGYTPQTAGLAMGYTTGCFTQARRDGLITTRLLVGLKGLCGIEPEDVKPDDKPEPEPTETETAGSVNVTVNIDSSTIATAIIDVLANDEARKQITQTIYFAVSRALRNKS